MGENMDDTIDLDRLSSELEKFNNLIKEGEDSDGGTEGCLETQGPELDGSPSFLSKYLLSVAKSGNPLLPWKAVKTFIRHKIDSILSSFYEKYGIEDIDSQNLPPFNYNPAKEKLLEHFDTFSGAPFTIQRLCEILIDPGRHYKRTDKLLRGLEKNILVVSTVGRLSDDCSDPQQRSTLFNGLQMTAVRSFRPPLPDNADKFPIASDDSDLKDDEGGPPQHNGDETGLLEDEEPNFEEECLKHDLEDDEMDDLDEELRPRLGGCGSALAGALAGSGSGHPALKGYSLSANSVISVRRKRKEEHKQHALHSKRIRMEHAVREQQLQQQAECKEEEDEEEGEEEVIIGPMPLEAMDTSCEDRLSLPVEKVEREASFSGSEDEETVAVGSGSPSKPSTSARVPSAADDASKGTKEPENPVLSKGEPVSEKDEATEMDSSVPEEEANQAEVPQEVKHVSPSKKSEETAGPAHQTKQDVKLAKETHPNPPLKAAAVAAQQGVSEQVTTPKPASVVELTALEVTVPMEQDPPETDAATDIAEEEADTPHPSGGEVKAAAGAVDTATTGSGEQEKADVVEARSVVKGERRPPVTDDDKGKVVNTSKDISPLKEKKESAGEKTVAKDVSLMDEGQVAAAEKKGQVVDSVEGLPADSEQPTEGSSDTPSVPDSPVEDDVVTQAKDEK